MKAIPLSVAFEVVSGIALAQGAADPMAHLRACAIIAEHAERLECLDRLSRDIAAPDRAAGSGDNWIISETTSPVNYTPMVTATASSRGGPDGSLMQARHLLPWRPHRAGGLRTGCLPGWRGLHYFLPRQ